MITTIFTFLLLQSLAAGAASAAADQRGTCESSDCASSAGSLLQRAPAHVQQQETQEEEQEQHHAPLLIEQDLSRMPRSHFKDYDTSKGIDENADEAFNKFVANSGLDEELETNEKDTFLNHFKEGLTVLLKHAHFDDSHDHDVWVSAVSEALEDNKPVVTRRLVDSINSANLGYTAELHSWAQQLTNLDFKNKLGKVPDVDEQPRSAGPASSSFLEVQGMSIPDTFETAAQFPVCAEVISRAHNQGRCGSCWAFGSLSAMDSRLCIKTNGTWSGARAMLSRGQTTSCALGGQNGCAGGLSRYTFEMFRTGSGGGGGVTGGEQGCSPYFGHGEGTEHFAHRDPAPPCPSQCTATYTARSMPDDRFKFSSLSWREVFRRDSSMMTLAKQSMMTNGPLPYGIYAGGAFMSYSSGIYNGDCSQQANHEVTAIGWGPGYINSMNSWGAHWGENGAFKVTECAVTDFTIFDFPIGNDVPSPLLVTNPNGPTAPPTPAPPVPTAGPTPAPTPKPTFAPGTYPWQVSSGPCGQNSAGCIMSGNYPGEYSAHEVCEFNIYNVTHVAVEDFSTEQGFDFLHVNGNKYSGDGNSIQGLEVRALYWSSDRSVQASGWKLCPTGAAPNPTPASTTMTTTMTTTTSTTTTMTMTTSTRTTVTTTSTRTTTTTTRHGPPGPPGPPGPAGPPGPPGPNGGNGCIDDPDWTLYWGDGNVKRCNWIANRLHRCSLEGDDTRLASEGCPLTCGTCS